MTENISYRKCICDICGKVVNVPISGSLLPKEWEHLTIGEKEYDACLDCFVKVDMAIEDLKERQEHMDRFIHCDEETMNKNNIVKAVPITEGMTIYFNDATSYYNEKNKLIEAGWEMISDDGEYSIYITSAPYECNNTNNATYRIK